jgi:hypothetical protein
MRAEARLAPPRPILSERLQEEALATSYAARGAAWVDASDTRVRPRGFGRMKRCCSDVRLGRGEKGLNDSMALCVIWDLMEG